MLKVYMACSDVAFTISTPKGNNHIKFTPTTSGGSLFSTQDAQIQDGIESHPWYQEKVFLKEQIDEKVAAEKARKAAIKAKKDAEKKAKNMDERNFTSLTDAKNWLAETYDVSRTKIRTKDAMVEFALQQGIKLTFDKNKSDDEAVDDDLEDGVSEEVSDEETEDADPDDNEEE